MSRLASLAWVRLIFFAGTSVIDGALSCWTDLSARFIPADNGQWMQELLFSTEFLSFRLTDWPRDKSCHRACMRGVFFGLSLFETWHLCEWHWLWKSGSERLTFHFSRRQTCVRNARLAGVYFVSAVCISVLFILLLQNLQIIVLIPPKITTIQKQFYRPDGLSDYLIF